MKIIRAIDGCPKPVKALFLIEAHANKKVREHADVDESRVTDPSEYAPIVIECGSLSELDALTERDEDIDKQFLVDKIYGRTYLAAIGQPGRITFSGSGEEDVETIDLIQKIEDRSIIYFCEVKDNPYEVITDTEEDPEEEDNEETEEDDDFTTEIE